MWSMRLVWLFGALFVLFGLPLATVTDTGAKQLWGGLSLSSLGGFGIALVFNALVTGNIRLQFSIINRHNRPRSFIAAVGLVSFVSVVVVIAGLRFIFFQG